MSGHRRGADRDRASQNFAELLRTVPGLNITQTSARDINVTSRGATGTLATGQLALLDGRSLYQDFFGFVMWDFLPVNLNEIKQIEVIRGPASAVWGANAAQRRRQRHHQIARARCRGRRRSLGLGGVRARQRGQRRLALVRERHARRRVERPVGLQALGWRLRAGPLVAADRLHSRIARSRPRRRRARAIPPTPTPGRPSRSSTAGSTTTSRTAAGCPLPAASAGTGRHHAHRHRPVRHQQRLDHELRPRPISRGRGCASPASFRTLDGDASNLLTRDPAGAPIGFMLQDQNLRHRASPTSRRWRSGTCCRYGGNLRFNQFDLSLAPRSGQPHRVRRLSCRTRFS